MGDTDPKTESERSDLDLVAGALNGDARAFRMIMERHNRRLYRVARALLKDDSEAEDAVQETYLRAFTALGSFRGEASFATWLTRITINDVLQRLRRDKGRPRMDPIDTTADPTAQVIPFPSLHPDDPERAAARSEIRALLERSIDALPEPFRLVFVMRDVEEMSIDETAAFLAIRAETVKTRLHRARRLLREALDAEVNSSLRDTFPFAGRRCERLTERVLARLGPIA